MSFTSVSGKFAWVPIWSRTHRAKKGKENTENIQIETHSATFNLMTQKKSWYDI